MPKKGVSSAPEYVVGDRDVRQRGTVGVGRPGRARLLLGEEVDRLARVGARSATERHDGVDAVAPGLQHRRLHDRRRRMRGHLGERRRDRDPSSRGRAARRRRCEPTLRSSRATLDGRRRARSSSGSLADGPGAEHELLRVAGVGPAHRRAGHQSIGRTGRCRTERRRGRCPVERDDTTRCRTRRRRPRRASSGRRSPARSGCGAPPSTRACGRRSRVTSTAWVISCLGRAEGRRRRRRRVAPRPWPRRPRRRVAP